MSPEKNVKKKSTAKTPARKGVKAQQAQNKNGGGNGPFYVLIIIILITVIVLLLNKFYDNGKFFLPYTINKAEKGDQEKEKNTASKEKMNDNKSYAAPGNEDKTGSKDETLNAVKSKSSEKSSETEKEVAVYFLKLDEKSEKIYLSTVKRKLPDKQLLSVTLEQLIKGPTPYEQGKGYITAVPPHLKIRSIDVKGKTAEIDFNSAIEEGAAGDILLKRIQQIVNTATQFENIDSIIIRINGQRRKTIGGDGFSIGGPLRR